MYCALSVYEYLLEKYDMIDNRPQLAYLYKYLDINTYVYIIFFISHIYTYNFVPFSTFFPSFLLLTLQGCKLLCATFFYPENVALSRTPSRASIRQIYFYQEIFRTKIPSPFSISLTISRCLWCFAISRHRF